MEFHNYFDGHCDIYNVIRTYTQKYKHTMASSMSFILSMVHLLQCWFVAPCQASMNLFRIWIFFLSLSLVSFQTNKKKMIIRCNCDVWQRCFCWKQICCNKIECVEIFFMRHSMLLLTFLQNVFVEEIFINNLFNN